MSLPQVSRTSTCLPPVAHFRSALNDKGLNDALYSNGTFNSSTTSETISIVYEGPAGTSPSSRLLHESTTMVCREVNHCRVCLHLTLAAFPTRTVAREILRRFPFASPLAIDHAQVMLSPRIRISNEGKRICQVFSKESNIDVTPGGTRRS